MSEETNSSVEEEVALPETTETPQEVAQEASNSEDRNWQATRKTLREQQQEIDYLRTQLYDRSSKKPAPQEPDEEEHFAKDDLATIDAAEKLAHRTARKVVKEAMQKLQVDTAEDRARARHKDYDDVVQDKYINEVFEDPALQERLKNDPNPYETAYMVIKKSHAYNRDQAVKSVSPEAIERISKNKAKPVSSNALGKPASFSATEPSDMSNEQIWEMAQKFASVR